MSKQTYFEKLKDPRWQRKRLEIMERDDFTCVSCGNKEKTLNVHHKTYRKGAEPWDYEDENFVTYCEHCHEEIHGYLDEIKTALTDSHSAMMISFLSFCNNDALEHMNSIRLATSGSLLTDGIDLNEERMQIVKKTVSMLLYEIALSEEHNKKLKSKPKTIANDPFAALDAMIDQSDKAQNCRP